SSFIRHEISDPNNSRLIVAFCEYLHRCVMVGKRPSTSRPRVPAGPVIDADDELAHNQSISKSDCSPVAFEFAIQNKPRHQAFVNRAHIPNHLPDKRFTSIDSNLLPDGSHRGSPHLTFSLTMRNNNQAEACGLGENCY